MKVGPSSFEFFVLDDCFRWIQLFSQHWEIENPRVTSVFFRNLINKISFLKAGSTKCTAPMQLFCLLWTSFSVPPAPRALLNFASFASLSLLRTDAHWCALSNLTSFPATPTSSLFFSLPAHRQILFSEKTVLFLVPHATYLQGRGSPKHKGGCVHKPYSGWSPPSRATRHPWS